MEKNKEPKEKPVKVKKIKKNKPISKSVVGTLIAFVLAGLVYVGFLWAQTKYGNDILYTEAIIVVNDVPQGTTITRDNAASYFKKTDVDSKLVPATALTSLDEIENLKTKVALAKNEIVTSDVFSNATEALKEYEDPVETSISVASIADVVAGKVRGGDVINITISYSLENNDDMPSTYNPISGSTSQTVGATEKTTKITKRSTVILENVYVTSVYDASGTLIATNDTTSNASVIRFTLEREDENELNFALANGSYMRISKTLNH